MSIRDRFFTRDIAQAAAERRQRLHDEELQREGITTPLSAPTVDTTDEPVVTTPLRERTDRVIEARPVATVEAPEPVHVETPVPVTTPPPPHAIDEARDRVAATSDTHAIFPGEEAGGFRSRWEAIQTGFVDEPRAAVEQADALVAQVVTRLAEVFSDERGRLEQHWDRGDDISTEDLRIALKRYRSFFDRLLSV